jgi:GT2 family glycosyltransferase
VFVIIVNWNRREETLACLTSFCRVSYPNFRILVVDNASTDGSVQAVQSRYPQAAVLQLPQNLRYAGGNNAGLREFLQSADDYVLLLNNDTTVEPDFLDHLVSAAQSGEDIGLISPKILYHDKPDVIWFAGGILKPVWGYVRHYGLRRRDDGTFDLRKEVTFLTGCCLFIKRKVVEKIGFLDEGFYLYSEDADYCLRARKAGFKLLYEPRARIYHKVSSSTGGAYNLKKWVLRYRSLLRLTLKHSSPLALPLFTLNVFWELISLPLNAFLQTRRLSGNSR